MDETNNNYQLELDILNESYQGIRNDYTSGVTADEEKKKGYDKTYNERAKLITDKKLDVVSKKIADKECEHYSREQHVVDLNNTNTNLYNFVTDLDKGIIPDISDEQNVKAVHWYEWFGAGADSKIHSKEISKRISDYYNTLFVGKDGTASHTKTVTVGKRWYQELINDSMFIDASFFENDNSNAYKGGLYKRAITQKDIDNNSLDNSVSVGDYGFYDKGELLFTIKRYDDKTKIPKHGNPITLVHSTNAFLKFSEMYNHYASEHDFKKFFNDGADNGRKWNEQYGDMFEEVGDMLSNVRNYANSEMPGVYTQPNSPTNVNFTFIDSPNYGTGSNLATLLSIQKKFMNNQYARYDKNGQMTNDGSSMEKDYLAHALAVYYGDINSTNIADLEMWLPNGNDFNSDSSNNNQPYGVVTDIDKKSDIRKWIAESFKNSIDKNKLEFSAKFCNLGNIFGYLITVPESNEKNNSHGQFTAFIPNFFDIKAQKQYMAREDVQAQMAMTESFMRNDKNLYRQVKFPQYGTTSITVDGRPIEGRYQDVKYNVTDNNITIVVGGEKYNLNAALNEDSDSQPLDAYRVMQDYLTVCKHMNNLCNYVYAVQESGVTRYLGQDNNPFDENGKVRENYEPNDKFGLEFDDYLYTPLPCGLAPVQLLALFDNPNLGKDIQNFQTNTLVNTALLKARAYAHRVIGKYYR